MRFSQWFLVVVLVSMACGCSEEIGPGEVGVVIERGHALPWTYPPGFHWTSQWHDIEHMSTRTQTYSMGGPTTAIPEGEPGIAPEQPVEVLTNDSLRVLLHVNVQFHLNQAHATAIFVNYGQDYADRVVHAQVRTAVRDAASEFSAMGLVRDRERLQTRMEALVHSSLESTLRSRGVAPDAVVIENILLLNTDLPQSLDESIANVQRQQQETAQREQALLTARAEAARAETEAQGHANALKIAATQEAESVLIRARSQAEANQLLSRSMTRELVEIQRIEAMRAALSAPGSRVIIIPEDRTGILFNLPPNLIQQ